MKVVKAFRTYYSIPNYEIGDCEKLESVLSILDEIYYKLIPKGYVYNEETKELRVPRGFDPNYLKKLLDCEVETEYGCDKYATTSFRLLTEPRDDYQRKGLAFLVGEGDYKYTKTKSQLILNLPTDSGKTYTAIAALYLLKLKGIVIVDRTSIKEQWVNAIKRYTNMTDDEIVNITSSSVIKKLMKSESRGKIFLITHSEINSYAKKNGWESIRELFIHLGIGVKIIDEVHLCFDNTIKIDLNTNVKKTFYLSATVGRSNYKENKLFNNCLSSIVRYGEEVKKEKRRHAIYLAMLFKSNPTLQDKLDCKGKVYNLDRLKYCEYLFRKEVIYETILKALHLTRDYDGKILLLSTKIDSVESIADFMREKFPDKKVATYHSKQSKEENDKVYDADIISATPKAFGTGLDIKGLRKLIITEPYSSLINTEQYIGRLRDLGDGESTFAIECIDKDFKEVYGMYKKRLKKAKTLCKKILEYEC